MKHYTTKATSENTGTTSTFSDYAINDADLYLQFDEIFAAWKLVSNDGDTVCITYSKIR